MKKTLIISSILFASSTVFSAAIAFPGNKEESAKRLIQMFKNTDKNDDGKISESEYLESAKKRFSKIDSNDDGFLSKSELKEYKASRKRNN